MEDRELLDAADRVFRAAAIEVLTTTVPKYSIASTYDLSSSSVTVDPLSLLDDLLCPSEPSTSIQPIIGSDGYLEDIQEVNKESDELGSSTVSMSLNRVPFTSATSIKGSSSNVPFYPGGFDTALDNILKQAAIDGDEASDEKQFLDADVLLTCPPGFSQGVNFSVVPVSVVSASSVEVPKSAPSTIDLDSADIFELMDFVGGGAPLFVPEPKETTSKEENTENEVMMEEAVEGQEDLDAALSTNISSAVNAQHLIPVKYPFARTLDATQDIPEYKHVFPNMAKKYPFDLDPFQQAAVVCMEKGESVFVAAHTSAGKTVVAEYAVALCKQHKTRAIYTSPIKALSNQKFRDFKMIFEDIGLVTGDIQLFPEAFCLIMTTEILRSMLYNGSEVIRDLEWVVFDEVHYINNAERGHVWEEVLIMLPAHVKIVMLSATVPNCIEFADWVGRIKNRPINVVSTLKRPVPLEHYLYTGQDGKTKKDIFKIVDADGQWITKGYTLAADSKNHAKKAAEKAAAGNNRGGYGGNRGGGGGGGGGGWHGGGNNRNDKNVYINLVDYLRSNEQLPMVVFVFSRKRCDDNAQLLSSITLTTEVERSHIHRFFADCVNRLKGTDKMLPQVLLMRELCMRGFAVHHSGILPILKEVVELLFQKGYVKILFATETFAMGVNMPARTVVFDSIQKHDGTQLRALNPGEYIQMAGRAGRRGLDTTGTVIVLAKGQSLAESGEYQTVMMGKACPLVSQFRVTYSMLLNLLRVEQLKIEDMLQRSYVESASLREGKSRQEKLILAEANLLSVTALECAVCEPNIHETNLENYHDVILSFIDTRQKLWPILSQQPSVDKQFNCGRVLIATSAQHKLQNSVVILLKENVVGGKKFFQVLVPCDEMDAIAEEFKKKTEEYNKLNENDRNWRDMDVMVEGLCLYGLDGVKKPSESGKRMFRMINELPLSAVLAIGKKQLKVDVADVLNQAKMRELPRFRSNPLSDGVSKLIMELDTIATEWANNGAQVYMPDPSSIVSSTDLDALILLKQSQTLREIIEDKDKFPARHCAQLQQHLTQLRTRLKAKSEVEKLKYSLSSDALLLSEDYQNRLKVLNAMGYIDNGNMVSFKGRVACEIHHQELLITELILENKLHSRSPAEVAALLSATTCQYKTNGDKQIKFASDSIFAQLKQDMEEVAAKMSNVVASLRVRIVDIDDELRYDLMEVVYHWANGMPFAQIMSMTEAQEGLIVRCIQRLGEVCKDVRNAARIVGDPALHEKMEEVTAAIKRDIVFAASLYTSM